MTTRALRRRGRADDHSQTGKIDPYDHDLLIFAIKWLPYGGAPNDEILPTFGLRYDQYLDRVREVVDRNHRDIHPDIVGRLLQMCGQRPRQRGSSPSH